MVSLNLMYNDKMTMASSVEGRVPFLDRELVEFAARNIPPRLKIKGTWRPTTKYIFHRAMKGKQVILEPVETTWDPLFESLSEFPEDFMKDGRNQPDMQKRESLGSNGVRELRLIQVHRLQTI